MQFHLNYFKLKVRWRVNFHTLNQSINVVACNGEDGTSCTTNNGVHERLGNGLTSTGITNNGQLRTTIESQETQEKNETTQ